MTFTHAIEPSQFVNAMQVHRSLWVIKYSAQVSDPFRSPTLVTKWHDRHRYLSIHYVPYLMSLSSPGHCSKTLRFWATIILDLSIPSYLPTYTYIHTLISTVIHIFLCNHINNPDGVHLWNLSTSNFLQFIPIPRFAFFSPLMFFTLK